jgi:hypothetical protein
MKTMEVDLNKRYQTMVTLWFALLMSVVMYFIFLQIAAPDTPNEPGNPPNFVLILGITAIGAIFVLASFVVKRKLLNRSVETQDVGFVQKAMLVACGMCEVSALLGLLERFIVGTRAYYVLFLIAVAGDIFHFPLRSQLEAASYKSRNIVS